MSAAGLAALLAVLVARAGPADGAAPAASGAAGTPEPGAALRPELSRAAVRLGEPFDLSVALRHAAGEAVELVAPDDLGPFALLGQECRTTPGERGALTACLVRLQLLDLGERVVPELKLRLRGPGGERVVPVRGARVRGAGTIDPKAPADSLELRRPAAPPVRVPSWRLVLVAGGAVLLALLAWLLVWHLRRRRARPAAPPLPPHLRFARRVEEVAALDLPGRGRGAEHVARLADAVREVLAALAPQAHLDLTSGELRAALAGRPVPGLDLEALSRALALADLVKFARHQPTAAACASATAFARELARRLTPAGPGEVAA